MEDPPIKLTEASGENEDTKRGKTDVALAKSKFNRFTDVCERQYDCATEEYDDITASQMLEGVGIVPEFGPVGWFCKLELLTEGVGFIPSGRGPGKRMVFGGIIKNKVVYWSRKLSDLVQISREEVNFEPGFNEDKVRVNSGKRFVEVAALTRAASEGFITEIEAATVLADMMLYPKALDLCSRLGYFGPTEAVLDVPRPSQRALQLLQNLSTAYPELSERMTRETVARASAYLSLHREYLQFITTTNFDAWICFFLEEFVHRVYGKLRFRAQYGNAAAKIKPEFLDTYDCKGIFQTQEDVECLKTLSSICGVLHFSPSIPFLMWIGHSSFRYGSTTTPIQQIEPQVVVPENWRIIVREVFKADLPPPCAFPAVFPKNEICFANFAASMEYQTALIELRGFSRHIAVVACYNRMRDLIHDDEVAGIRSLKKNLLTVLGKHYPDGPPNWDAIPKYRPQSTLGFEGYLYWESDPFW